MSIQKKMEPLNDDAIIKAHHPVSVNLRKLLDSILVNFYRERFNGEERFIILTDKTNYMLSDEHLEDLNSIVEKTYIYLITEGNI